MASYISSILGNSSLLLGTVGGAIAGGVVGGMAIGGENALLIGGLMGVGGAAAGLYAGHKFKESRDRKAPAPLGVRINSIKAEPGKGVEMEFSPSFVLSESIVTKATAKLQGESGEKYASSISRVLPYTNFKTKGTTAEDGNSIKITEITLSMPGQKDVPMQVKPEVVLVLKDGKVDENHPENKAKLAQLMEQSMMGDIPKEHRAAMHSVFEESFAAAAAAPPSAEPDVSDKALKALDSPMAKALMSGAKKTAVTQGLGAAVGPGGIPALKAHNGLG